jgi:mRNA-degrading endonuclease RelE of RelBE toxin-antitoxin system
MFEVVVQPTALRQLRHLRRVDAVAILDAIDHHLGHEPERPSRSRIKRLRGPQRATYRLRVGDYRAFYDVSESRVTVVAILHKRETGTFYMKE